MSDTIALKVTGVLPQAVPMLWPRVAEFLRPAVEIAGSLTSMDVLLRDLCTGRQFLWIAHDGETVAGAAVAEMVERPAARVCAVPFMGGRDFERWGEQLETAIADWARTSGCTVFEALVRRGLVKHYSARGFREIGTVIRRAI